MLDRPHVSLAVLLRHDLPIHALRVYVCLCAHANEDLRCFPSVNRLGTLIGADRRSVQRAIALLVERGIVKRVVGGGRYATTYLLTDQTPAVCGPAGQDTAAVPTPAGQDTAAPAVPHTAAPAVCGPAPRTTCKDDMEDDRRRVRADEPQQLTLTPSIPEPDPEAPFRAAWLAATTARRYGHPVVTVGYASPRAPARRAERLAAIRAVTREAGWQETLAYALASDLARGAVRPTDKHPNPRPWGADQILRHWHRFEAKEWGADEEALWAIRVAMGLAEDVPPTVVAFVADEDIPF